MACLLRPCCSLWYKRDGPDGPALQRLREGALTAVGLVIIGRPKLMLQPLQLSVLDHQHSAGALATSAHSGGSGDAGSPEHRPQRQLSSQGSGAVHGVLAQDSVVKVYTTVLSEDHVPISVKGRVLGNLVDLLRWVVGQRLVLCWASVVSEWLQFCLSADDHRVQQPRTLLVLTLVWVCSNRFRAGMVLLTGLKRLPSLLGRRRQRLLALQPGCPAPCTQTPRRHLPRSTARTTQQAAAAAAASSSTYGTTC